MPVAEAGIEEALTHLELSGDGSRAINGWYEQGSNLVTERILDASHYSVSLSPGDQPVITSSGSVRAPLGVGEVTRTVEVRARRRPVFPKVLFGIEQVHLGGTFLADSFDSGDPEHSVSGRYEPSRRKDGGNIATNGRADLGMDVGSSVRVYGRADTGPGGVLEIGKGSVGSSNWVNAATPGVEPGWSVSDVSVSFPEAELPFKGGLFTPVGGVVDTVRHKYVLQDGPYRLSTLNLSGQDTLLVQGDAALVVDQDVSTSGEGAIIIQPGARLELFVKSGLVKLGGTSVLNLAGKAENFSLVGLPGMQAIKIAGNGEFIGTVYAPTAHLILAGGGTSPLDFVGAAIVKTVTASGHYQAHYDEALNKHEDGIYIITSWREL